MSFVSHFYVLGLTSWTWTNPSIEELKSESPSKYTSLKHNPSKRSPKLKIEDVTWSPQCALLGTRTNKHKALSKQEVELDGWCVSNSSHCTENMFHIIHARVPYECCISFLCSWIVVLDLKFERPSILTSDHHHQSPIYPILSLSLSLYYGILELLCIILYLVLHPTCSQTKVLHRLWYLLPLTVWKYAAIWCIYCHIFLHFNQQMVNLLYIIP